MRETLEISEEKGDKNRRVIYGGHGTDGISLRVVQLEGRSEFIDDRGIDGFKVKKRLVGWNVTSEDLERQVDYIGNHEPGRNGCAQRNSEDLTSLGHPVSFVSFSGGRREESAV